MAEPGSPDSGLDDQDSTHEIVRLDEIIPVPMDGAERGTGADGPEIDLLRRTILLEEQLRARTAALEAARHEIGVREEKLRGLYELSPLGIALNRMDGSYLEFNEAFRQITGYEAEELKRLDDRALAPHRYEADEARQLESLRTAGRCGPYEKEYIRKDGSLVPTELTGILVTGRDGQPCVLSVVEDITARKHAERQSRIAAAIFESQAGIAVTDADSVILRVNRAFTAITGFAAEEAVGNRISLLKSGCHDAAFYAAMWRCLRDEGIWQGEIWGRRKNGEVYPQWLTITEVKGDAGEVTHYVATLTDITLHKAAEDEIEHLAFYDPLTRLPNRRLLLERLGQAIASSARSGRPGALLFIDLDNFKTLNDTVGHDVGDLLLQAVARRLVGCARKGDTVARLGGDEFVIMLEDLSANLQEAATQVESVGQDILAAVNQPYLIGGHERHATPSIGATLFNDDRDSIDELLKRADLSMYEAKAAGRNRMRFFDPAMQAAITARSELEAGLRQGIEKHQFVVHYQPQVDGKGGLTGAEALVRWRHPVRGLVSPAEFIPLAEETGLIRPLGNWVLETACLRLVAWARRQESMHLTLAVNVSARQFHQEDFVEEVLAVLDRTGADPRKLKLELTESLLLHNVRDVAEKMFALKAKGVGFSLDDFGTGYSSLSYLKQLPLDQLKIDRSFVADVLSNDNDAAIVRTIVALAESMGLAVIAEGVETMEQRDFLVRQNCHAYQGYLYGRPMPAEEFERILDSA